MHPDKFSFGERAVGMHVNPPGSAEIRRLKKLYAEIIDIIIAEQNKSTPDPNDQDSVRLAGERLRLWQIAITETQGAQMWAVRAATWR